MPIGLEQFVKQLEDSGILSGETLKEFLPPKLTPKDAGELARELVRKKKLTKFQAEEVYKGKAKSLVLGNYVLLEKIGEGGMGQVFKARHRRMDRIVAVKLLSAAMTKDEHAIARFEREVKAAARISHPNIVAAHDADCANGVHFLVMEFVEGSDLSALVKKQGPFSPTQAIDYLLQAAQGLAAAHAEGLVHRDIKPANLLLDRKGVVKILDMGLARLGSAGDATAQAELTSTGMVMGTIDYMSPEQAMNTKTADARADIYALGCSLYFLLTGKATYAGDSLMAKLIAHREAPIPSLQSVRTDVSEPLQATFSRMVAKRVEDRYESMAAVIADLQRCRNLNRSDQTIANRDRPSDAATFRSATNGNGADSATEWLPSSQEAIVVKTTGRKRKSSPSVGPNRLIAAGVVGCGLLLVAGVLVLWRTGGRKRDTDAGGNQAVAVSRPSTGSSKPAGDSWKPATKLTSPPVRAAARDKLFLHDADFASWVAKVQAMPAEKQVFEVGKKLREINPGFEGSLSGPTGNGLPLIEGGMVTETYVSVGSVTDLSPMRAFAGLKSLHCASGSLTDLSPLQGMPLTALYVGFNSKLTDLAPLRGMPLTVLNLQGAAVTDLSHLEGMPLQRLVLRETQVADLTPLKGMPLTQLDCMMTKASGLSVLAGMPLEFLTLPDNVDSLTPIKDLRLTYLEVVRSTLTDLSPLRDMPLQRLTVSSEKITDIEPLRNLKLVELILGGPALTDLSPLQGMPLQTLILHTPAVTDVSPLKEISLHSLTIILHPDANLDPLRSMKSLVKINDKPPAEFWAGVKK